MSKRKSAEKRNSPVSGPYFKWGSIAVVLLITTIVFSGVNQLGFQMQWDDHEQVVNNPYIKSLTGENLKHIFSSYVIGMYQPLTSVSYALDYQVAQLDAGQYHNTNLILHLLNVFLVWLLFRKLINRLDVAFIATLFFAIHPMQAETVYWISTRSNLLFTSFFLGGLITYHQFKIHQKAKHYVFTVLLMLLACLSKSMAVTFPLALLAIDYLSKMPAPKKALFNKIPFFVVSLIFGVVAISYTEPDSIALDAPADPIDRIFFIFYSLHFYIAQALVPLKLSAAHYFPEGASLPWQYYLAPLTLLAAVLPGVLIKSIRRSYFFGLAFFLVTIGLVVLVPGRRTIVAERYVYLPYVGLFFAVLTLVMKLLKDEISSPAFNFRLVLIIGLLAVPSAMVTASRQQVWQNSDTLFKDVSEKYPANYHSYAVRGLYHLSAQNAETAIPLLEAAVKRKDDFHEGFYNLGIAYGNHLQQHETALKNYNRGIDLQPDDSKYFVARGTLLGRMKKYSAAEADFNEALRLDPENARAYENLGVIYADQQDFESAIDYYTISIRLDSGNANTYISRGAAYSFLERHAEAIADYNTALSITPDNTQAIFNRGVSEFKRSNSQRACIDWKKAMDMGNTQAANAWRSYCRPS